MMKHTTSRLGLSLLGITSAIACAGILVDGLGCAVAEPTALFLGVSSDMRVADDFDSVGLFISVNGEVKYQGVHPVSPTGEVLLPASLSILQPDEPSTPVHIRVAGYRASQVIAVRDAITTIPSNQISVLRLPVQWLSTGTTKGRAAGSPGSAATTSVSLGGVQTRSSAPTEDVTFSEFAKFFSGLELPCPAGQTSVAGTCESVFVSPNALVAAKGGAHVGEVYGGAQGLDAQGKAAGGACFSVEKCFAESEAVRPEDITVRRDGATIVGCEIPKPRGASLDQLTVAIDRDGTPGAYVALNSEAAEEAKEGGWRDTGAALALPPAVCARLGTTARGLRVSTRCAAKRAKDPTCGPWSAVKNAQEPGFTSGRYYTEVGPVDAGRDGPFSTVDAADGGPTTEDGAIDGGPGPVDANFDAGPPEPITFGSNGGVVAPTRMAFDDATGTLWIKGRQGTIRVVDADSASRRVEAINDLTNCTFGYVAARGGLGAVSCHSGAAPGYFRVETDGSNGSGASAAGVGLAGALVTETTPVIGSIVPGAPYRTYLKFLNPTSVDPVEVVDGTNAWQAGVGDLFYRPAGGDPEGTIFFTGGPRVYLTRTRGLGLTTAFAMVAELPPSYAGTFHGDALFVHGPNLFFYGTNNSSGVIFQYTLPSATPIAGDASPPLDGGTAGVDATVGDGGGDAGPGQARPMTADFTMTTENPGTDKPALVGDETGVYWSDGHTVFWLPAGATPATAPKALSAPTPNTNTYAIALSAPPAPAIGYVYWAEFDRFGTWTLRRVRKPF
jgi:hypothetical protein